MPKRSALRTRRKVAALSASRVAEPHRYKRDLIFVIKILYMNSHPRTQSVTAIVLPWHAADLHSRTRSLADHQNRGRRTELHDGARRSRQVGSAQRAGSDLPP